MSDALLDTSAKTRTWLAIGPAGTIGWISGAEDGFTFTLVNDREVRGPFPTLDVAKSALYSRLPPGTDWPEFSEH
jgi:hypothetical protein